MFKISIIIMIISLAFLGFAKILNFCVTKKRAKTAAQIVKEQKEAAAASTEVSA